MFAIFGGRGFLGGHLCDRLLELGHEVRVFDRPSAQNRIPFVARERLEIYEGDFSNDVDVSHAISGCHTVFHLISTTLPKGSNDNPVFDIETNVVGTLRLLEAARRQGVRKIVFVSSGGTVYGRPETIPIAENHPTEPACSYGIGKLAVEKYLSLYHQLYGLDYRVLRLANPYGERQRVDTAQGAAIVFLHKALRGEPLEIWGDGSVVRDFIYVGDVVDALCKAMEDEGDTRLFNVGSGRGHSLTELIDTIEEVVNRPVQRRYLAARPFDVPANVLDISRAKACLNWQPGVDLHDGLRRTMTWLQDNPDTALPRG